MSDNTVPNLDCMSSKELMSFWSKYRDGGRLLGEDGQTLSHDTVEKLACYASNKACAQDLRLEGKIAQAMAYEAACDIWYNGLPQSARW